MIIRIKLVVQVLNCYMYIVYTGYRKLRFTDEPWSQMNRLKIKINKIYIRYHYINDWDFILFKNKKKYTDHLSRLFSRSKIINKIINIIIWIISIYKTHFEYLLILIINWISNQNQDRIMIRSDMIHLIIKLYFLISQISTNIYVWEYSYTSFKIIFLFNLIISDFTEINMNIIKLFFTQ